MCGCIVHCCTLSCSTTSSFPPSPLIESRAFAFLNPAFWIGWRCNTWYHTSWHASHSYLFLNGFYIFMTIRCCWGNVCNNWVLLNRRRCSLKAWNDGRRKDTQCATEPRLNEIEMSLWGLEVGQNIRMLFGILQTAWWITRFRKNEVKSSQVRQYQGVRCTGQMLLYIDPPDNSTSRD